MSRLSAPSSLNQTFWLFLALPRAILVIGWVALNQLPDLPALLIFILALSDAGFLFWQVRHILRSADAHVRSLGSLAPVWGCYLAILFAAALAASLWWQAYLTATAPSAEELFTDRMDRQHAATYSLTLSADGTDLQFEGMISHGLTKRARALAQDAPLLARVSLSSSGGHIYEARGLAKLIVERQLDTHASKDCASACTLIFAAGRRRSLGKGARLGFHQYALNFTSQLPQIDLAAEQEKDRIFLRARGVGADFLTRIFDQPSSGLWYPDQETLRGAGLVTR